MINIIQINDNDNNNNSFNNHDDNDNNTFYSIQNTHKLKMRSHHVQKKNKSSFCNQFRKKPARSRALNEMFRRNQHRRYNRSVPDMIHHSETSIGNPNQVDTSINPNLNPITTNQRFVRKRIKKLRRRKMKLNAINTSIEANLRELDVIQKQQQQSKSMKQNLISQHPIATHANAHSQLNNLPKQIISQPVKFLENYPKKHNKSNIVANITTTSNENNHKLNDTHIMPHVNLLPIKHDKLQATVAAAFQEDHMKPKIPLNHNGNITTRRRIVKIRRKILRNNLNQTANQFVGQKTTVKPLLQPIQVIEISTLKPISLSQESPINQGEIIAKSKETFQAPMRDLSPIITNQTPTTLKPAFIAEQLHSKNNNYEQITPELIKIPQLVNHNPNTIIATTTTTISPMGIQYGYGLKSSINTADKHGLTVIGGPLVNGGEKTNGITEHHIDSDKEALIRSLSQDRLAKMNVRLGEFNPLNSFVAQSNGFVASQPLNLNRRAEEMTQRLGAINMHRMNHIR